MIYNTHEMRFPSFNPNQNLSQYNFTQYFNPSKMKKIIESEWNVEYDEDWLLENGIKDIALKLLSSIRNAATRGVWQAAAWWMERSFAKWSKDQNIKISGDSDEPVQVNIKYSDGK